MSYWRRNRIRVLVAALGVVAVTSAYAQERSARLGEPSENGPLVYALMNGSNSIAVIDLARGTVLDRFSVEGNPHGGTITPDGLFIYTASMASEKIYVLDAQSGTTVDAIQLGSISHHSAVSPDGRFVYTAADQVVVIDTASNEVRARIACQHHQFLNWAEAVLDDTLRQANKLSPLILNDFLESLMLPVRMSNARVIVVEHKLLDSQLDLRHASLP